MWIRVNKSSYGDSGGLSGVRGGGVKGGLVLHEIIKIGEELEELGIEFSPYFVAKVGNGSDIGFWVDR